LRSASIRLLTSGSGPDSVVFVHATQLDQSTGVAGPDPAVVLRAMQLLDEGRGQAAGPGAAFAGRHQVANDDVDVRLVRGEEDPGFGRDIVNEADLLEQGAIALGRIRHGGADDAGGDIGEDAGCVVEVAVLGDADGDLVPDEGEVAGEVDDVAAEDLGVGEGDECARRLLAGDGFVGPADLPDGSGEEVDLVDVAEHLAHGDAVTDAVVCLEGVHEPAGEALDRRLEGPGECEADEAGEAEEGAGVAGEDAEGDAEGDDPDGDPDERARRLAFFPASEQAADEGAQQVAEDAGQDEDRDGDGDAGEEAVEALGELAEYVSRLAGGLLGGGHLDV